MKNLVKSIGLFIFAGLLLSLNSCEKVAEIVPIPSMKATVDGEAWTSIFRASVLNESQTPATIVITGTPTASESADKAIILTVKGTEAGTYNLSTSSGGAAECLVVYKKTANATDGGDNYYVGKTATIVISKMDKDKKRISGTFSATLVPSSNLLGTEMSITNGTFEDLNYQVN